MDCAFGHIHEHGQIAVGIKSEVELDGAFGLAELCPRKDGQAQIDGSGIEQVDFATEFEPVAWSKGLAACE